MAIGNFESLKSEIEDWLLRDDLGDTVETFIELGENALQRDRRVRRQVSKVFTVDSETESLPSNFVELESLYHDGPTWHNEIEIVSADFLSEVKRRSGDEANVPTHAALIDGSTIRFAPVPSDSFDLRMVYWETIAHLGDNRPSNWLLDDHSDVYLYASLVESAPYLHDEERLPVWRSELERRLEDMHVDSERKRYSGSLNRQVRNPIP